MKPIAKLYLKVFLLGGIPCGLIITSFDLLIDEFELWKSLFQTFYLGISLSLSLVSVHIYKLKKNGIQELTDETLGVKQTKEIKTKFKKRELVNKLKTDPIIGKMKMTETDNGVTLKTGTTWESWGDEIKIVLKSASDPDFEYQISSRPKLKLNTALVDFGRNLQNLNRIENVIKNTA